MLLGEVKKKQNVVACSSAQAEFRGFALGLCEALWLRLLLEDLGYSSRQPIRLYCFFYRQIKKYIDIRVPEVP